jgi:hypothetical protein
MGFYQFLDHIFSHGYSSNIEIENCRLKIGGVPLILIIPEAAMALKAKQLPIFNFQS